MRADTPSTNLLEAAPKMLALICLVRNSVSAMARMLITTPLITWFSACGAYVKYKVNRWKDDR